MFKMEEEMNFEDNEEFDVIEVEMSDEDIDEIIAQLTELKQTKGEVEISLAEDLDLIVKHVEDSEDGGLNE